MKDEFGGELDEERDEFGGVLVAEEPEEERDEFGGVLVGADESRAERKAALVKEQTATRRTGRVLDATLTGLEGAEAVVAGGRVDNMLAAPWKVLGALYDLPKQMSGAVSRAVGLPVDDAPTPRPYVPAPTQEQIGKLLEMAGGPFNELSVRERLTGAGQGGADLATSLIQPEMIGAMLAGGIPGVARRLAAYFATDMASHVPEAARHAGEASATGDLAEQMRADVGLLASMALPAAIVGHARPFERGREIKEALPQNVQEMFFPNDYAKPETPGRPIAEPTPERPFDASQFLEPVEGKAPPITSHRSPFTPQERPLDVIDLLEDYYPKGLRKPAGENYAEGVKQASQGAARELFTKEGEPLDSALDGLHREGHLLDITSEDGLIEAVRAATAARQGAKAVAKDEARTLAQDEAALIEFQEAAAGKHDAAAEPVAVEALKVGDEFNLKGEKFEVREVDPDTGDAIVQDGPKFGEQRLPADGVVHPDQGKVRSTEAEVDFVPDPTEAVEVMASPGAGNAAQLPLKADPVTQARTRLPAVLDSYASLIELAEGGEVPLRTGRVRKPTSAGQFAVSPRVIRVRTYGDLPTATHEVFHALEEPLGPAMGHKFSALPSAARAELRKLGQALYPKEPANGWLSEGWAEFGRHWLSTDEAAKVAPAATKWFETQIAQRPGLKQGLTEARRQTDTWRDMGSEARLQAQQSASPGWLARQRATASGLWSDKARQWVEALDPLRVLSDRASELRGRKLRPSEDPFLIASLKRGSAGKLVDVMVRDGMVDIYGRPTGGKSLVDAIGPAINKPREFTDYLYARRAIERWGKGKNPGIGLQDAIHVRDKYDSPAFQGAAQNVYEWWGGVLNYLEQANPAMKPAIDRIRAESQEYVPLAREFDPATQKSGSRGQGGNPLMKMQGSGRGIKPIWETTLRNTQAILEQAHRAMTLRAVADLAKVPEIGHLLEEVPRDRVAGRVNFEQLREQLEGLGVDTSLVPKDELMNFFSAAKESKGADPIVAIPDATGQTRWYQVTPELYDALAGLEKKGVDGLTNLLLMAPKRMFTLTTTGLRSSFALITNPIRDLPAWLLQTQSHSNPARLFGDYLAGMKDAVTLALGRPSEAAQAFERLGVSGGNFFGGDIAHTQRAAKGLFHGKVFRIVRSPIEAARELIGFPEAGPRIAEMRALGRELGWQPGQVMTPDQAIKLGVAAKRATVDFSAHGRVMDSGKPADIFLQSIPFFNAAVQGTRSFARAVKERPARALMMGLGLFTVPALANWWANKDKEWYKALPWRERYQFTNLDLGNGVVMQIPRSQGWGDMFAVAPEALADWWHTQDPEGATKALGHILDTANPIGLPVLLGEAWDQRGNYDSYWQRPIVPRAQEDLPAAEQTTPYTSRVANWVGKSFNVSPTRVDHVIRSLGGGVASDIARIGSTRPDREAELSDTWIAGRLFRRGGEITANSRHLQEFWDLYSKWGGKSRSKENPLTPAQTEVWHALRDLQKDIKDGNALARKTPDLATRQRLYRQMSESARRLVEDYHRRRRAGLLK